MMNTTNAATLGATLLAALATLNEGERAVLEDVFRAYFGEYNCESPEAEDAAWDSLYAKGLISADPRPPHYYRMIPSALAFELFDLHYPCGIDREPRNAEYASLVAVGF